MALIEVLTDELQSSEHVSLQPLAYLRQGSNDEDLNKNTNRSAQPVGTIMNWQRSSLFDIRPSPIPELNMNHATTAISGLPLYRKQRGVKKGYIESALGRAG